MRYEMQVWVSVSAPTEYDACRTIKDQVKKRGPGYTKSDVEYIDAEALKSEPECHDCGALNPGATIDYQRCPLCEAQYQTDTAREALS